MRLLLGILKGVALGGGLGLLFDLSGLPGSAPWLNWIFYPLLGALVGLLGGKPLWNHDRTTVIIKAVIGAAVLAGLYALVAHAIGDPRLAVIGLDKPLSQLPELLGALLGLIFGAFVELDEKAPVGRAARVLWFLGAVAVLGASVYVLAFSGSLSAPPQPTPTPTDADGGVTTDAGGAAPEPPTDAGRQEPGREASVDAGPTDAGPADTRVDGDLSAERPRDATADGGTSPPDGAGDATTSRSTPADAGPTHVWPADGSPPALIASADAGGSQRRPKPRKGDPRLVASISGAWLDQRVWTNSKPSGDPRSRLMDRGELIFLGSSKQGPARLVFWRVADGELVFAPTPKMPSNAVVEAVLLFDRGNREAALLFRRDRQRTLLWWDLRRPGDAVAHNLPNDRRLSGYNLSVGGYDPLARQLYAVRLTSQLEPRPAGGLQASSKPSPAQIVAISASGVRPIGPGFTGPPRGFGHGYHACYDSTRRRFALLAYGEHPYGDRPPPRGQLVDPLRGPVQSFEVPAAAYAAHFTADGSRLLIHGHQRGTLWEIDLASGKRLRTRRTGAGWTLGVREAKTLFFVRDKSLELLDTSRLTLRQRWPLSRLLPRPEAGYRTSGSLVLPRRMMMLAVWGDLHLLRFDGVR